MYVSKNALALSIAAAGFGLFVVVICSSSLNNNDNEFSVSMKKIQSSRSATSAIAGAIYTEEVEKSCALCPLE